MAVIALKHWPLVLWMCTCYKHGPLVYINLVLTMLQDVYLATAYKPVCPQPTGNPKVRSSMNEDCLYLNIWTTFVPQNFDQGRRRPVVILIEGKGSFTLVQILQWTALTQILLSLRGNATVHCGICRPQRIVWISLKKMHQDRRANIIKTFYFI